MGREGTEMEGIWEELSREEEEEVVDVRRLLARPSDPLPDDDLLGRIFDEEEKGFGKKDEDDFDSGFAIVVDEVEEEKGIAGVASILAPGR